MVIAGLGIGPSFAVFTLIVQNAVPPDRIGVATSSLTFFQQIGGTVGLTIAGTLFAEPARRPRSRPSSSRPACRSSSSTSSPAAAAADIDLTGTGDLGARILASAAAAVPGRRRSR